VDIYGKGYTEAEHLDSKPCTEGNTRKKKKNSKIHEKKV
jgi:hypothetical protein